MTPILLWHIQCFLALCTDKCRGLWGQTGIHCYRMVFCARVFLGST